MEKADFNVYKIKYDGIFACNLIVVVSNNEQKVDEYLCKHFKDKQDWELDMMRGAFFHGNNTAVIWIRGKSYDDMAVLGHELLHATFYALKHYGLKMSDDSEEAYTHFFSHMFKKIVNKIL